MKIYQYDFKNYKESTIEDLLYMTVDELIAYRDELFCSDAIRSYKKIYDRWYKTIRRF